jgi:Cd2+/Zn2+-exporting ATPase
VAASPCAVVIATPAAMLSAITHAARHGVLFKGSLHLERLGSVTALAFDKTGTITEGKPRVVRVATGGPDRPDSPGREEAEMLRLASAVEARSEHHTGRAVVAEARRRGIAIPAVSEFESHSGEGVHGHVEGRWVGVGREALFARHGITPPRAVIDTAGETRARGETALLVVTRSTVDGAPVHCEGGTASPLVAPAIEPQPSLENGSEPSGVIAVADSLRPGARAAIDACRAQGIRHIAILTGDHERVARPVAEAAGVDEVRAGLMPDEKVSAIRDLLRRWPTLAMAGVGVNDAPALTTATVGIAMGGAGTDVALDTADVVLMRDDLKGIPFSLWLARRARRVVIQSLSFAFGVIGVLVISTLSGVLPLWLAVVCHEGSTLLTIANGVRLLAIPHRDFELG